MLAFLLIVQPSSVAVTIPQDLDVLPFFINAQDYRYVKKLNQSSAVLEGEKIEPGQYSTNSIDLANPIGNLIVTDDLLLDFQLVLSKVSLDTV